MANILEPVSRDPGHVGGALFHPLPFRPPAVDVTRCADGSWLFQCPYEPSEPAVSMGALLRERAGQHPDRPFLAQRPGSGAAWRIVTFGEALRAAEGFTQWAIDQGMTAGSTMMILSDNSIEHGLLTIGGYLAGIPVSPISANYSLRFSGKERLRYCFEKVRPKIVYADDTTRFGDAIRVLLEIEPDLLVVSACGTAGTHSAHTVFATVPTDQVRVWSDGVGHADVAKYMFTSGSTGLPKCVPQTHGMATSSLAAIAGLEDPGVRRPASAAESLDWMPWSHVAGSMMLHKHLFEANTIYIDDGRPTAQLFDQTIANYREISPREFRSVPVAFAMLADAIEKDPGLRSRFFRDMTFMAYGGATLTADLYERMQALAVLETGKRFGVLTVYGATETECIAMVYWTIDRTGLLGLPIPGVTLKLVPCGTKLEVRVKGPNVMGGYLDDPARNAAAFDEDGFFRLGDAARFVDPGDPRQGLVFDGRLSEDFKLLSGTWISVGTLRADVIGACAPYVQDLVITGADRNFVGALIWLSAEGQHTLSGQPATAESEIIQTLRGRLKEFNRTAGGTSRRIARFLVLTEPPSLELGEITDKGYVNQALAQTSRAAQIVDLYAQHGSRNIIVVE